MYNFEKAVVMETKWLTAAAAATEPNYIVY
jgi:hypothetical protein